jgi:hypothetical protein
VIDFQNDACDRVEAELFEPIFEHLACGKDIELLIVDDEKIKELNLEHRARQAHRCAQLPIGKQFWRVYRERRHLVRDCKKSG